MLFTKTQSLNMALPLQAHFLEWHLMRFGKELFIYTHLHVLECQRSLNTGENSFRFEQEVEFLVLVSNVMDVYTHVYMCMQIHTCIHTYMYTCAYPHAYTHVCNYIHMVLIYKCTYKHVNIITPIYIYKHTYSYFYPRTCAHS